MSRSDPYQARARYSKRKIKRPMLLDCIFYGSTAFCLGCMALAAVVLVVAGPIVALPFMMLFQIFLMPMFVCVGIKKSRLAKTR